MTAPRSTLVTHAVLACKNDVSDKIWAGVVVQTPGQQAQTITYYGGRGKPLMVSDKGFATTPKALAYFDTKMQEKLEQHGYRRCDWRDSYYDVTTELPRKAPVGADDTLRELRHWGSRTGERTAKAFADLPRPNTPEAYAPGVYVVDQEPAWYYVVPQAVPYGYALSPNAMLVERMSRASTPRDPARSFVPDGAALRPTWVWRARPATGARPASPAFLEKATDLPREESAALVRRVYNELIAAGLGF